MPEEYHEAVHYNLMHSALRQCIRQPVNPVQAGFSQARSLNTIKVANTFRFLHCRCLVLALRFGRNGNSFYIFNADAR
jgi:hypothetical protein